jgi:penicillin amidase/acyl-homoserine-lactone acylase
MLNTWNGAMPASSREAALILLTSRAAYRTFRGEGDPPIDDLQAAFRDAMKFLKDKHGRIDPELGEVQRLRRGAVDLPIGGGVDLMNATYGKRGGGLIVGTGGDSLVVVVDFAPDGGTSAESVHAYGASSRPSSPHYNDQSKLFVEHQLKPTWHEQAELDQHSERSYRPGTE